MGMIPPGLVRRIPRLPRPIAAPLQRAAAASDPSVAHAALMEAASATVGLLGAVALLDAAAAGRAEPVFPTRGAPPLDIGWWRRVVGSLAHKGRPPTLPALRTLRADPGRWAVADAAIGLLCEAQAAAAVDPLSAPRDLPRRAEVLTRLLAELPELAATALLYIDGQGAGGAVQAIALIGPTAADRLSLRWPDPPPAGQVVLIDLGSQRWIGLDPLYRWDQGTLRVYVETTPGEGGHRATWAPVDPDAEPLTTRVDDPRWLRDRLSTAWGLARGQVSLAPADHAALSRGLEGLHSPSDALVAAALTPPPSPAPAAPEAPRPRARSWGALLALLALLGLIAATAWFALSAQGGGDMVGPLTPAPAPTADAEPRR